MQFWIASAQGVTVSFHTKRFDHPVTDAQFYLSLKGVTDFSDFVIQEG